MVVEAAEAWQLISDPPVDEAIGNIVLVLVPALEIVTVKVPSLLRTADVMLR